MPKETSTRMKILKKLEERRKKVEKNLNSMAREMDAIRPQSKIQTKENHHQQTKVIRI